MKCIINRRAQFSASHRYWLPELSEAENQTAFGLCAQPFGHGHNYVIYISLYGDIDDYGMVLNLSDVKHVIKKEVTGQLDYGFLNEIWPEFKQTRKHRASDLAAVVAPFTPRPDSIIRAARTLRRIYRKRYDSITDDRYSL
jgi:6-pyruvoyl-tetrahydropterin synthase